MLTDTPRRDLHRAFRTLFLMILAFALANCASQSRQAARHTGGWSGTEKSEAAKMPAPEQKTGGSEDLADSGQAEPSNKAQRSSDARSNDSGAKSEEERVRSIAEVLAKRTPKVAYMKLCCDRKRNEWWITLYQDAGFRLELKQFIWNKTQDKAEAFAVLRYVSRGHLKEHLAESTPEKPCKAYKATEDGWTGAAAEPAEAR